MLYASGNIRSGASRSNSTAPRNCEDHGQLNVTLSTFHEGSRVFMETDTKTGPVTCTRLLQFDAGHRVYQHEGKCANLHGHRYTAEITAQAEALDKIGRVIDFSVLK